VQKTAEPMEMLFTGPTHVGTMNHGLRGGSRSPRVRVHLRKDMCRPL